MVVVWDLCRLAQQYPPAVKVSAGERNFRWAGERKGVRLASLT